MKKNKKFFSIICASLICALPCAEKCHCARVQVTTEKNHMVVRLLNNSDLDQHMEEINRHLAKGYVVEILDGGSYYNTARADDFESHHLISSHFCSNHPEKLSRSQAPAVVIPKAMHRLTGSHPCSGFMNDYLQQEERTFATRHSIHDVAELGIRDLVRAVNLYYKEKSAGQIKTRSRDVVEQTPVKHTIVQVQAISPNRSPIALEKLYTPKKSDAAPIQTFEGKNLTPLRPDFIQSPVPTPNKGLPEPPEALFELSYNPNNLTYPGTPLKAKEHRKIQ